MVDSFRYLSPASAAIVKMLIARAPKAPVPWAPLPLPLEGARVALVSTAALAMRGDPPFDTEGERANPWWGDPSFRVIPRTATERDIVASHLHIDTAYLEQDLEVALPLRALKELADPTEFLATSVPAMVERMKGEGVDAAVFVPV